MAWSQAVLQNTGEITCKSQASISYSLCLNPRAESLAHHWNRNFTCLHFISAPGHPFYCCVDTDILVLPIFFSLTCQSTPHHLQPIFQHCNWDCRCHHLISKHLCMAQKFKSVPVLSTVDTGKRGRTPYRAHIYSHMERTGADFSQFSLPWSTQPVSTGLFTNLKHSIVLKHLLKTNIHQLFCFLIEVLHKWFCCV